jgi:glycosyltransferase involved in cell wall biosynthesis
MDPDIRGVFVTRVQHNLALAISTQNINITAFNFDKGPVLLTPENIKSGLKSLPRLVHNRTILDGFRDTFILSKAIQAARPDIVHIDALQDLFSVFIAVQICAIKGHKPAIVAMARNSLSWRDPKKAWLFSQLIKSFCDGFIALATTHKNELLRLGVPADKVTVIPNAYDPSYVSANPSSGPENPDKGFKIIYIANICENKAQDVLIQAAACVLEKYPEVKFELVGKVLAGEEEFAEKLHSLIKKYGIQQSIDFTGEIPYEHVLTALQKSDIFVFPTLAEMMPRAVIEAMVLGKPVIASGTDGVLDLIQNRKTGLLVQPGNATELADALCEFIGNPVLAHTLGQAGQKYILDFCSPENVGRQVIDFYKYIRSKK